MVVVSRAKLFYMPMNVIILVVLTFFSGYQSFHQMNQGNLDVWAFAAAAGFVAVSIELRNPFHLELDEKHLKVQWLFGLIEREYDICTYSEKKGLFLHSAISLHLDNGRRLKLRRDGYKGIKQLELAIASNFPGDGVGLNS